MPEPMVALLESVWDSIAALCASLTDDEWDRPTDCPGWSVKDQVSHMVGTERMLLGEPAPTAEVGEAAHVRNDIGKFNEAWVAERRDRPGAEVLAEFGDVTARRLAALRAMSPQQWDEEGFTPEGPGPYRQFMEIRVFDCWYHEQDIREALGRPGDLVGPVAEHTLRRIPRGLPYAVGKKAAAPQGASVVFEVAGDPPLEVAIGVDGRAAVLGAPPAEPTVRIVTDRRTYSRLAGGRWSGDRARAEGHVEVAGDEALGRAVVDNLGFTI